MKKMVLSISVLFAAQGAMAQIQAADIRSVDIKSSSLSLGQDRGGGDICENQIKIVRDDLARWIQKGGPQALKLPAGVSVAQYSEKMLEQISIAKIRCVGAGDVDFPVKVYGAPKVCKFERTRQGSTVTCSRKDFNSLGETAQYVLVHHEFAGLAGLESPNKEESFYELSNQISSYLETQTVQRLVVKPRGVNKDQVLAASDAIRNWAYEFSQNRAGNQLCRSADGAMTVRVAESVFQVPYLVAQFFSPKSGKYSYQEPLTLPSVYNWSNTKEVGWEERESGGKKQLVISNYTSNDDIVTPPSTPKPNDKYILWTLTFTPDQKAIASIKVEIFQAFTEQVGSLTAPRYETTMKRVAGNSCDVSK